MAAVLRNSSDDAISKEPYVTRVVSSGAVSMSPEMFEKVRGHYATLANDGQRGCAHA